MYASKYRKTVSSVEEEAVEGLKSYNWPGNIRELQHAIERAIIMSDSDHLTINDFFFLVQNKQKENLSSDSYNLEEIERNVLV